MNTSLLRHGFILLLISLAAALLAPQAVVPRLAVSAHSIGFMGGTMLLVLGAIWPAVKLGDTQKKVLAGSWLYANYGNWLGVSVASMTGATELLSINGGEPSAPAWASGFVMFMMLSISAAALLGSALGVYGIKKD